MIQIITIVNQLVKHRYKSSKRDLGTEQLVCQQFSMNPVPKGVYKQWKKC